MMILKKGAQVKIISGKDKGKTGEILEINRKLIKLKLNLLIWLKDTQNLLKKIKVELYLKKVLYINQMLKILM